MRLGGRADVSIVYDRSAVRQAQNPLVLQTETNIGTNINNENLPYPCRRMTKHLVFRHFMSTLYTVLNPFIRVRSG